MNIRFRLRPAKQEDAASVADVFLASRKSFVAHAPLAHTDADVRTWIRTRLIPGNRVTVAEIDDQVVGVMSLSEDAPITWLDHLYIAPGNTRQGIGLALLEQAKQQTTTALRLYVFQASVSARRFYERHGLRAIAFSDGTNNEEHCPDVLYEWIIGDQAIT